MDTITILGLLFAGAIAVAIWYIQRFIDNQKIKQRANKAKSAYAPVLKEVGVNSITSRSLIDVDLRAREKVFSLLEKYDLYEDLVYDTKSSLGICAYTHSCLLTSVEAHIMSTDKLSRLELFSYFKNYDKEQNDADAYILVKGERDGMMPTDAMINEYEKHLKVLAKVLHSPVKITGGRVIKAKNIEYYKVEGNSQYVSDIKGGGANLAGAVYGGIIGGGVGAGVVSQLGVDIKTESVKRGAIKLLRNYNDNGAWTRGEIISDNIDNVLSLLREWMPDKEYSYVVANNNSIPTKSETKSLPHYDTPRIEEQAAPVKRSYAELKELKELLDLGIITQAELDQKKREILG